MERNLDKTKEIDSGTIKLGVQRHGYHEYFLKGNKFESKLHFRVVPIDDKEYWVAFTSVKQKPVNPKSDKGIWDITTDKFNKLTFESLKQE